MKDEAYYKQLLINADDLDHYEFIPGTDWDLVFEKVELFADRLKQKIGIFDFDTRSAIQDAAFHSWIRIGDFQSPNGISIKFSNFGNLVTISNIKCLSNDERDFIFKLFEEFNYVFIPKEILLQPYERNIEGFVVNKSYTWVNRFFDFI